MTSFSADIWPQLLSEAIDGGASDIHLSAEQSPFIRRHGQLERTGLPTPSAGDLEELTGRLTDEQHLSILEKNHELDFAVTCGGQRLRFNASIRQGAISLTARLIPGTIPSLEALGCPPIMRSLLKKENGLILITGRTGSGKTTTIAAFLAELARTSARHIITLEDPVEYLIPAGESLIDQREYGSDFLSFPAALKSALRSCPDLIVVGELRDAETVSAAINAAETGHLVIASLHTQSAAETMLRLESFFPAARQEQLRVQLSLVLQAVISQRLLPAAGGGLVCASEVLTAVPAVRNLIRTGKLPQLKSVMLAGRNEGMQTMEFSLEQLCRSRRLSPETAARLRDNE